MKEIVERFEAFCEDEIRAFEANKIPDLEKQQDAVDRLHEYVVPEMHNGLGVIRLQRLNSPLFYRIHKGEKAKLISRTLFKVSKYAHTTYGTVWVIYCSEKNVPATETVLSDAFFMIEQDGILRIAHKYVYANYASDGFEYAWSGGIGIDDLTFESLGELLEVKRFNEPSFASSKEIYYEEA